MHFFPHMTNPHFTDFLSNTTKLLQYLGGLNHHHHHLKQQTVDIKDGQK